MVQESLAKIQAAEAEAKSIRSTALEEAKRLCNSAQIRGKAYISEKEARLKELCQMRLAEADKQAELLIAQGRQSANEEAEQLTKRSSAKIEAAAELILERIQSLWQ